VLADGVEFVLALSRHGPGGSRSEGSMTNSEDSMTDESEESQGSASTDGKKDATLMPRLFQLADRRELPKELQEQAALLDEVQELKAILEREYALTFDVRTAHPKVSAREIAQPCSYDTIQAACSDVAKIARSGLCEVYDLKRARANHDSQDLKGAMLRCGLRKQRGMGLEWSDCLRLIVSWNHVGIFRQVLSRLKVSHQSTRVAMEVAFHNALCDDKVDLIRVLLSYSIGAAGYDVRQCAMPYPKLWASARLLFLRQKQDHEQLTKAGRAIGRWMNLFSQALTSPMLGFRSTSQSAFQRFDTLLKLAREEESANRLILRSGAAKRHQAPDEHTEKHGPDKKDSSIPRSNSANRLWSVLGVGSALEKISFNSVRAIGRKGGDSEGSMVHRTMSESLPSNSHASSARGDAGSGGRSGAVAESKHSFAVLESVYGLILGDQWHYRTGSIGPEMDLFLWVLLMRRQKMAKLIWGRLESPIRTALTAVVFYRNWAEYPEVKPHEAAQMLESAQEFEDMAMQVTKIMLRLNEEQALEALERPCKQWRGLTSIDVALMGNSKQFIKECCGAALDYRWSGDLEPYHQPIGLYPSVLLSVLSCGVLAPYLLEFRRPPRAELLRPPTQKMRIPVDAAAMLGARSEDDVNNYHARQHDRLFLQLQSVQGLGKVRRQDMHKKVRAESDGTSWQEKIGLFFLSPVTLFVIDALQQVVRIGLLLSLLFHRQHHDEFAQAAELDGEAASSADAHAAHAHAVHGEDAWQTWNERVVCLLMFSSTVTELAQVLVDGARQHFAVLWNWCELFVVIFFWLGFSSRAFSSSSSSSSSSASCAASDADGMQNLFYSLSLFFMWTSAYSILSIHEDLGPLVIVIRRMGTDMVKFAAVWLLLLLAFSCLLLGAELVVEKTAADPVPVDGGAEGKAHYMGAWASWWFWRTYYQAMGQPFFDEMPSLASNATTIVMWPIMNVMMVNLLVAIMSDTYAEVICVCMSVCLCVCVMMVNLLVAILSDTYAEVYVYVYIVCDCVCVCVCL